MKKIRNLIYLMLVVISVSCLDESSDYTLSTPTVFSNEKDAQLALNGCYGYMISYDLYGQQLFELAEGGSGLFYAQSNAGDPDYISSLVFLNSSSYASAVWRGAYRVISNANGFIAGIESSSLNETYKNKAKGEALFLRAICYYNLGSLYEKAPINVLPADQSRINLPASSSEEVLNQAIADFLAARDLLVVSSAADPSVPTQNACNAFIAKIYYYKGDFANAKLYGDLVIGKYSLEPTYANLFKSTFQKTSEDIFVLNNCFTYPDGMGNHLSWVFSPQASTSGNSWARWVPTKSFFDFYMSKHQRDPRMISTFFTDSIRKNSDGSYMLCYPLGINYSQLADPSNPTKDELNKMVPGMKSKPFNPWTFYTTTQSQHNGWPAMKKTFDVAQGPQLSHMNIRVLRYTDILLMMADVENELPTGDKIKALQYVNSVLTRARNAGTNGQPVAWGGADLTRVNLYHERLFELFGEGFSFMDTRRWGVDFFKQEICDRHDRHWLTIEHSKLSGSPAFYDHLFKNKVSDWSKVMHYPVPKTELDKNSSIIN